MKYFPLVWKNTWRRPFRTTFTLLVIIVSFMLFGGLMTVRAAFTLGVELLGQDRLILIHKISLIQPLPVAYQTRIAATPGVEIATHASWFGGVYQDPANFFAQMAVEPDAYMKVYEEYSLPPDQMQAWLADRQGAIVGRDTADRFGWKIGDRIPIQGTIFLPTSGSGDTWDFNLVGIYDGEAGIDKTNFFFRYDYLDENRQFGQGIVGWYIVKVADPSKSTELALTFDEMFANSSAETETTTEKGFIEGFAKQIGDIGSIMVAILVIVLFGMLLVVTVVMTYSVRERTSELAVLKTLGFTNTATLALVLVESVMVVAFGGSIGLGLAWWFVQNGDPTGGMLPAWVLPSRDLALGVVLMLALGVVAGLLPAVSAMQLRITDALRRA